MEHALTRAAVEHDTDFVARVARQWTEAIDQDGSEPTETELRHRQGVFIKQPRRGLQRMEILATTEQSEHLLTAMNIATNPRTRAGAADGSDGDGISSPGDTEDLDQRTRPQQLLDGLVNAVKAGLSTGGLPAAGGLRPQVMVTIDYRHLLARLENREHTTETSDTGTGTGMRAATGIPGTGSFTFTGPVTPATVRKIACDADIIPSSSAARAASWTSAAPRASSRPTSAKRSPHGTKAAPSPAAPSPPPGAKPTTSPTGHTAEPPAQTTAPCSAAITTT
jgi:hypothetical protein